MVSLKIKAGILDLLQERAGIKADDAFARSLSVTTETIDRAKSGAPVSAGLVATISHVYGLTLSEVAYVDPNQPARVAA